MLYLYVVALLVRLSIVSIVCEVYLVAATLKKLGSAFHSHKNASVLLFFHSPSSTRTPTTETQKAQRPFSKAPRVFFITIHNEPPTAAAAAAASPIGAIHQ